MIDPLLIDLDVDCPPGHAFAMWTGRCGQWWPRGHSVSGVPAAVVLEPRLGGRIFERTRDGVEIDWGEITCWEPPVRLAYRWHLRRDQTEATDVEIQFGAGATGTARLRIRHSGWERLGADADPWREANRGGWSGVLPAFAAACETTTAQGASA
jgi:uncharacterized protein YndB with AHSA1/START domain